MRKQDIVVGGVYTDGKSTRHVIDEGEQYASPITQDKDYVLYRAPYGDTCTREEG